MSEIISNQELLVSNMLEIQALIRILQNKGITTEDEILEEVKALKIEMEKISIRRNLAKSNSTHPAFDPERSNLTFTGQLQNALAFKKLKTGLFQIFSPQKILHGWPG